MRVVLLLCLLSLAGCVTTRPQEPIIVTQTVEVPVTVKCQVSYPNAPSPRLASLPLTATGHAKATAALQELEDQRWYSKKLRAALDKCSENKEKIDSLPAVQ